MTSLAWDLSFPMENVSRQLSLWQSESCYENHLFSWFCYIMFSLVWLMLIGLFSSLLGFLYNMSEYENNNYNVLIKTKKNLTKKRMTYILKHLGRNPQTWLKMRRTCKLSTDNGDNFERYHVLCDDHEPNVCRQLKLMPYYSVHFLFRWQSIIQLCCLWWFWSWWSWWWYLK